MIDNTTQATMTLAALRLMRSSFLRPQDRSPGSAWRTLLDKWLALECVG